MKCKVDSCNNKAKAQGYCSNHYLQAINKGIIQVSSKTKNFKNRKCSIEGCNKRHYAKGYCRNHYANWIRTGNPIPQINKYKNKKKYCLVCLNEAIAKGYCKMHYQRFRLYGNPFYKQDRKKENSHSWKGGIFDYPNHSEMRKNRLKKLESINWICEECGGKATEVHHKDLSKNNHNLNNFVGLCHKCHLGLHAEIRKNKKKKKNMDLQPAL